MTAAQRRLGRVVLLLLAAVLGMGIGAILALLADIQDRFGYPTWALGVIAGVTFLTTFATHLLMSPLADRGWERRVIALGTAVMIAALLWMVYASLLWHWVAARALLGFAEGAVVSSGRRVMLSWDQDHQGRALSLLTSALLAGFLLGPPLGGALNEVNTALPFLVPAAMGALMLPLIIFAKPDPYARPAARLSRLRIAAIPGMTSGLIVAGIAWFIIGVMDAVWSRYASDLGAGTLLIGFSYLSIALPSVALSPVGGSIADRTNPVRLAMLATFATVPVVFLLGWAPGMAALMGLAAVYSSLWAFQLPTAQAAAAKVVPPGQSAEGQAIMEGVGLLCAGAGAFAAAPLYGSAGPRAVFGLAAALSLTAALGILRLRPRWRKLF